jgi:predicted amidohydrolase
MRVGLVQLTSSDDPARNLVQTSAYVREASRAGAEFILTPEVTNCVSSSRAHQETVLQQEEADITLDGLRHEARAQSVWLLIGSLGLKVSDGDGRFANRSFLIDPAGEIVARYDKIHMFDVDVSDTETYRESAGYAPGDRAVVAKVKDTTVGLSICYDLRFPHLYRALAKSGAAILTVPAAFSPGTGPAHWESLLRARAIENGCFVLAPAQCGQHDVSEGRPRRTHGRSLAVAPWGEILADGGDLPGVTLVDLNMAEVDDARRRVPSLKHDRPFEGPQ